MTSGLAMALERGDVGGEVDLQLALALVADGQAQGGAAEAGDCRHDGGDLVFFAGEPGGGAEPLFDVAGAERVGQVDGQQHLHAVVDERKRGFEILAELRG